MIPRTKIENSSKVLIKSLFTSPRGACDQLKRALADILSVSPPLLTSCASAGFYYLLKLFPGRKIYLQGYTCRSLIEACFFADRMSDLRLVDIELNTYGMDVEALEKVIEPKSIIVVTHQFGIPAPISRFLHLAHKKDCLLVEDNAAAFGAKVDGRFTGTWGDVSLLSFEHTKTLSSCGGGAIFFRDAATQKDVEKIQNHEINSGLSFSPLSIVRGLAYNGLTNNAVYKTIGFPLWCLLNGYYKDRGQLRKKRKGFYFQPFGEQRANLALSMLRFFREVCQRRKEIELKYLTSLKDHPFIKTYKPVSSSETALMIFPIRILQRSKIDFYKRCLRKNIDLGFTFSYVNKAFYTAALHNCEDAANQTLNLPFYSKLKPIEIERICSVVSAEAQFI